MSGGPRVTQPWKRNLNELILMRRFSAFNPVEGTHLSNKPLPPFGGNSVPCSQRTISGGTSKCYFKF